MQQIVLWTILYNWHFTPAVLDLEKDFYLIFHTSDNSLPEAVSLFFNKLAGLRLEACNFMKKETPAQVFSCEFCEISKNTFSYRTPPLAASGLHFYESLRGKTQFSNAIVYPTFREKIFSLATTVSLRIINHSL